MIGQCKTLNVTTPSIRFDQPLWLKVTEIDIEKSLNIVIHLRGFHTLMSFVGSIGSLMDGSGIETVLQTVYGKILLDKFFKVDRYQEQCVHTF